MSALESSHSAPPGPAPDRRGADPVALVHEAFTTRPHQLVSFLSLLARRHRLGERLRIIDTACGSGSRLPALCGLATEVVGLEESPRLRRSAERRVGPGLRVREGRVDELEAPSSFDLALSWDGALCYLHDVTGRVHALRRILRLLRPGGLLVLDLPTLQDERFEGSASPREIATLPGGYTVSREVRTRQDEEHGLVQRRERAMIVRSDGSRASIELLHRMSIIGAQELSFGLRQAGFTKIETWPDVTSDVPGPSRGSRLLMVGRR